MWDVDLGKRNEDAVIKARKGVSTTAMSIVDDDDDSENDNNDGSENSDKKNGTNETVAVVFQKSKCFKIVRSGLVLQTDRYWKLSRR